MKQMVLKGFSTLLLLALLVGVLPLQARAEGGNLYVTGYTVTDASGKAVGAVKKDATVDITVSIKDINDSTQDPGTLDITKLDDSFTGGSVSVEKTSDSGAPLTYAVRLTGLKYKGVGQTLKLQVGTPGSSESYQTIDVTITEAVVYEAPTPSPPEPAPTPDAAPAPMVIISRSELKDPVEAGQEFDLTVTFQNLGRMPLKSPVATFSPSDGLSLTGGSSSFVMEDIPARKSGSVKIRLKAAAVIASASQSIGAELKFNYFNNLSYVAGEASDKIPIPAVARESVPQPVVIVTRSPLEKPLAPGQSADVTLSFRNAGTTALKSPVATVTSSDALLILNDATTFLLPDIPAGSSSTLTVKLRAAKEISSPNQSLSTELKYSYDSGGTITQATASDRVNLSAEPTVEQAKTDASAPNIVIQKFTYGGASVAAGSKFPLQIIFQNTGTLRVENVVVTVECGESFAMDGSTNTFFYKGLSAGGTQSLEVPMQVVPTGKSGAQSITAGFKYEYVDGSKRSQASADIKISIPVYQPDRFQINNPVVPEFITVGEETEVSLAYVNKGKDDIANVEATVEGDGVETPARTQYIGNITAGTSGSIGFALTPTEAGETEVTLKITYENANQELQTREFSVTLRAEEPAPIDDFPDEMPVEESGTFPWIWVGGGIAVVGAAAVLLLRRRRHKAAAAVQTDSFGDWEEDDNPSGGEA